MLHADAHRGYPLGRWHGVQGQQEECDPWESDKGMHSIRWYTCAGDDGEYYITVLDFDLAL